MWHSLGSADLSLMSTPEILQKASGTTFSKAGHRAVRRMAAHYRTASSSALLSFQPAPEILQRKQSKCTTKGNNTAVQCCVTVQSSTAPSSADLSLMSAPQILQRDKRGADISLQRRVAGHT